MRASRVSAVFSDWVVLVTDFFWGAFLAALEILHGKSSENQPFERDARGILRFTLPKLTKGPSFPLKQDAILRKPTF